MIHSLFAVITCCQKKRKSQVKDGSIVVIMVVKFGGNVSCDTHVNTLSLDDQ